MTKETCLTIVVFPKRCVPKNTVVEIIKRDPNDTRLNWGNLRSIFHGFVILCCPNAQKLFKIKFHIIESSAENKAAKKGAKPKDSEKISNVIALIRYPTNPVMAYFIKGE